MKLGIGQFRSPEDAERYRALGRRVVEKYWPAVEHTILELETPYGTTQVRQVGTGAGTPIVLIHPFPGSSTGLYPFVGALCRNHTLYLPETMGGPGYNIQTEPVQDISDLASWLDHTLDGLRLDHVHLAGYSQGGFISAVHAALTARPERLVTVTLLDPGGAITTIRPTVIPLMTSMGLKVLIAKDKPAAMQRVNHRLNGSTYDLPTEVLDMVIMASLVTQIPRPKKLPDDTLRRITMPTLLLLGEDSILYNSRAVARRAGELLPNPTVEVWPGGHGFVMDSMEAVLARMLDFIDHHDRDHVAS